MKSHTITDMECAHNVNGKKYKPMSNREQFDYSFDIENKYFIEFLFVHSKILTK